MALAGAQSTPTDDPSLYRQLVRCRLKADATPNQIRRHFIGYGLVEQAIATGRDTPEDRIRELPPSLLREALHDVLIR